MEEDKIGVLDHGFIHLQDMLGDEMTVVNTARVSFGKQKTEMDDSDVKLMRYLLRQKHFSPFRHIMFRFHVKAPEVVLRQWYKHVVGAEWSSVHASQLHGWNEISGRYVHMEEEFYVPQEWRKQSEKKKQGSDGLIEEDDSVDIDTQYKDLMGDIKKCYNHLLEKGVAKEQARLVLPLSVYTECIWTASFQSVMNFLELRLDSHAQWEIQKYAQALMVLVQKKLPILFECWQKEQQAS